MGSFPAINGTSAQPAPNAPITIESYIGNNLAASDVSVAIYILSYFYFFISCKKTIPIYEYSFHSALIIIRYFF